MERAFVFLILVAFVVVGVAADPQNLSGGVFIAHYVPELGYTTEPPPGGWCEAYAPFAIQSCEEQNVRIDVTGDALACTWYVLSAWWEPKEWCGTEFGLGGFDPALFTFLEWHPCYPPTGGLEIGNFEPEPYHGTAFVTTGDPWEGDIVPVFCLGGYANPESGSIPLGVDPATGFGGWANCASPPEAFMADCFGALGINAEGTVCIPAEPIAVCCTGCLCTLTTAAGCDSLGGIFHPTWPSCTPDPCVTPSPVESGTWGRIKVMYR
jgi:hypothetical protein